MTESPSESNELVVALTVGQLAAVAVAAAFVLIVLRVRRRRRTP